MTHMPSWTEFETLEHNKHLRQELLFRNGNLQHLLFSQQLDRSLLEHLITLATAIRRQRKTPEGADFLRSLLRNKRILCLFVQPSTRTVESFTAAAEILGANTRIIQDMSTSSFVKGESEADMIRTVSSYFDAIVTRHKEDDFALKALWTVKNSNREIPIISGGSGASQHVTQSLLDVYTLGYSFEKSGGMDGKTIMLVSDLKRNRAARSLIYLLTKFKDVRYVLVSPPDAGIDDTLRAYVTRHGQEMLEFTDVHAALTAMGKDIDAIYMTRNQSEYGGSGWENPHAHQLLWADAPLLKQDCVLMHPLPRNDELPTEWDNWPTNMMWRQVRNGMWMRAAIFAEIFGVGQAVLDRGLRS